MGKRKPNLNRLQEPPEPQICMQPLIRRRPDELLQIRQSRRIYDRAADKFSYNVSYQTHTKPTPRSLVVAEAFGLGIDETQKFKVLDTQLTIRPRDIVYITGDSGSGKSVLLRAIKADLGNEAADLSDVSVDPKKPLIETIGATVEEGLQLLSRVGLNDAFLFLRSYSQLSDGQKYRYRIAKLIESKKQWWLMDEFAACLDRDTAKIIAFNLQKTARQHGKAVIAATTHADLFEDLKPNVHVQKRFGEEIQIEYFPDNPQTECSLTREMKIEPGTINEWRTLSKFHYRGHNTSVPRKIFCIKRNQELCGVIVYSYPPPACYGRRQILPKMTMKEMNQQLCIINRVVIHPKYRTIGLGAKLIRETLPLTGTPNVEMIAVMAKYSPFAEKAGMQKILQQQSVKSMQTLSKHLENLGFDLQLIGSTQYTKEKLATLNPTQLNQLKEAFIKNGHPRFRKEFASGQQMPYGKPSKFKTAIWAANPEKIVSLIKLVGNLRQTKVYLFWKNPNKLPLESL